MQTTQKRRIFKEQWLLVLIVLLLIGVSGGLIPQKASALNNGLALTPPMGFSTWNELRRNVSDSVIRNIADNMVSKGLVTLGYSYINIDDGWWDQAGPNGNGRDTNGNILYNTNKFPFGIKALADYVHSKGINLGLYTDIGSTGCTNFGSYGHYQQDANQFAAWGIDFVKIDACGGNNGATNQQRYQEFRNAILNVTPARPIMINICEWGSQTPWVWGPETGNYWRVGFDIDNQGTLWNGIKYEVDQTAPHASSAGPGHWNDPDSLEVGVSIDGGKSPLTHDESISNFSMWAVLAAPLNLGLSIPDLDNPATQSGKNKDVITNAEVIAIDQDVAGIQGTKVDEASPGLQVYSKPLGSQTSGNRAVVLFNRNDASATMTVTAAQIGLTGSFTVRDLWQKVDKGTFTTSYSATIPAHGSVMLKISGTAIISNSYEAEASINTFAGGAVVASCANCSGTQSVGYVGNGNGTLQINNVNVSSAGNKQVTIYYVNGDSNRAASISINGGTATSYNFPSSGGWSTVGSLTITLNLNSGNNTIKFSNSIGWAPDFDKISVATPSTFEAESTVNTLTGSAVIRSLAGASGGNIVGNVGNGTGNALQFNNISADTAGTRTITIYYINGDTTFRTSQYSVNGQSEISDSFPSTGSWTTIGTKNITVNLNAGNNTLKFYNSMVGSYGPDFDKAVLQ